MNYFPKVELGHKIHPEQNQMCTALMKTLEISSGAGLLTQCCRALLSRKGGRGSLTRGFLYILYSKVEVKLK